MRNPENSPRIDDEETAMLLHDMHCHLGFMSNGEDVAGEAHAAGTSLFANTVTPDEWTSLKERFAGFDNVAVGFGMHPWWVKGRHDDAPERSWGESQRERRREQLERAQNRQDVCSPEAQDQLSNILNLLEAHNPSIIGEVGLDFGWSHVATRTEQLALFEAIVSWTAERGKKLLSIHAVKSAAEAFETLQRTGALDSCACIFHWFTGPSDLLKRAVKAGCYFSCGPRMLATGKGREYIKAIPATQLLLETDAPPQQDMPYSFAELQAELKRAAQGVADIKGAGALDVISSTSEELLRQFE